MAWLKGGIAETPDLTRLVPGVFGQAVWDAHVGYGNNLRFELGAPVTEESRTRGEWSVWIQSAWRMERGQEILGWSSDDEIEDLQAAFLQLVGRRLESIAMHPTRKDTLFRFEDGIGLRVFPALSAGDSFFWILTQKDRAKLIVGPETEAFGVNGATPQAY